MKGKTTTALSHNDIWIYSFWYNTIELRFVGYQGGLISKKVEEQMLQMRRFYITALPLALTLKR